MHGNSLGLSSDPPGERTEVGCGGNGSLRPNPICRHLVWTPRPFLPGVTLLGVSLLRTGHPEPSAVVCGPRVNLVSNDLQSFPRPPFTHHGATSEL